MKYLVLIFIITSCIQCAPKKSVTVSETSLPKALIENEQLNVLYRGIGNPLTIYMPNTDSITVTAEKTNITKIDTYHYTVYPGAGTHIVFTITGYRNGNQIIDHKTYRILDFGKPYASIHNQIKEVTLTKEELTNATIKYTIVQAVMESSEVSSFEYQINNNEYLINQGNSFDAKAKEKITHLKKGDLMVIDHIKLAIDTLPNYCRQRILPLTVHIE